MQERNIPVIEYAVLGIVLVLAAVFFLHLKTSDIDFSRRVFAGLVEGNPSVRTMINWEKFEAIGADVGATYRGLPSDKDRLAYQKAFILAFSLGFKKAGARWNSFTNWRVYKKLEAKTIIAADYPAYKKTLLLILTQDTRPRLVAIAWEGEAR